MKLELPLFDGAQLFFEQEICMTHYCHLHLFRDGITDIVIVSTVYKRSRVSLLFDRIRILLTTFIFLHYDCRSRSSTAFMSFFSLVVPFGSAIYIAFQLHVHSANVHIRAHINRKVNEE